MNLKLIPILLLIYSSITFGIAAPTFTFENFIEDVEFVGLVEIVSAKSADGRDVNGN